MYWNTSNPLTGHLLFFLFFPRLSHGTIDSLTSFPPIYHLLTSSAATGGTLPLTSFAQSLMSLITHHHPSSKVQTPTPPPPFSSSPANTQLQLRPFWPTSTQYPLPVAPPPPPLFFLLCLSQATGLSLQMQWSLRGGNTHGGSQCSPVSECLRGNLFRNRERKREKEREKGWWQCSWISILFQFIRSKAFTLQKREIINKRGMFTSFSIFFFSFHHTAVVESMWMFSRFIAKSIPVHGSHSLTPNSKMRVHRQGPAPLAATSRFTSNPTLRKQFFFFSYTAEKKVTIESPSVHSAVTALVWFDGLHL